MEVRDRISGMPLPDAAVVLRGVQLDEVDLLPPVIEQQDYAFVPEYSIVPAGEAVSFPNRDRSRHHVYSFSPAKSFELKLYVGLPASPVIFDQPGVVTLGCNIHDWMYAIVYVVDGAVAELTDKDGVARFQLAGSGYPSTVSIMHPRINGTLESEIGDEASSHRVVADLKPPAPRPSRPPDESNALERFVNQ